MKLKPITEEEKKKKGHDEFTNTIEACLPKGVKRTSAPSRYINYQPLGSSSCSNNNNNNKNEVVLMMNVIQFNIALNSYSLSEDQVYQSIVKLIVLEL
ncbi:hypothetical protein AHAS_Ahas09G0304400 [Arachis hypogaea]